MFKMASHDSVKIEIANNKDNKITENNYYDFVIRCSIISPMHADFLQDIIIVSQVD